MVDFLLRRDEEGQGLAEYALILALIAIVAIVALLFLGSQISTILSTIGAQHLAPAARQEPNDGPSPRGGGPSVTCWPERSTGAAGRPRPGAQPRNPRGWRPDHALREAEGPRSAYHHYDAEAASPVERAGGIAPGLAARTSRLRRRGYGPLRHQLVGSAHQPPPRRGACANGAQGGALLRRSLGARPAAGRRGTLSRLLPAAAGAICGEWTPGYMLDAWTPALLREAAPDARLLVLLRDPVERFRSGRTLAESRFTVGATARAAANAAFNRGLYADQLLRLWQAFPRHQVLVLQYEQCVADPRTQLERTFAFIGLAEGIPAGVDLSQRVNASRGPKVTLGRWQSEQLARHYAPENERLAALLPDFDLSLWQAPQRLQLA